MQIAAINPDSISDLKTFQIVIWLLNPIEALVAQNAALRVENQHLRDELARLTRRSGKPDIKPPMLAPPTHPSEAERPICTPLGKPKKHEPLTSRT